MSVNSARIFIRIFSNPAWKFLRILGVIAFIACFIIKGKKRKIPVVVCSVSFCLYIVTVAVTGTANHLIEQQAGSEEEKISDADDDDHESARRGKKDIPQFSENTMFTLRIYEPWIYESLHYTVQNDGTLIVLYYSTELGREKLSDEKMKEIRKVFSPEKVYTMDIGKEDDMTDGVQRYIILYDSEDNEIQIGGYELKGGDHFNRYFDRLYELVQDDYTKQWSDKLDECIRDNTTFAERYLNAE